MKCGVGLSETKLLFIQGCHGFLNPLYEDNAAAVFTVSMQRLICVKIADTLRAFSWGQ